MTECAYRVLADSSVEARKVAVTERWDYFLNTGDAGHRREHTDGIDVIVSNVITVQNSTARSSSTLRQPVQNFPPTRRPPPPLDSTQVHTRT
jgi:hypothetical protein